MTDKHGSSADIIVLDQSMADNLWRITVRGQDILLLTKHTPRLSSKGFELASVSPNFDFATVPAIDCTAKRGAISRVSDAGIFTAYNGHMDMKVCMSMQFQFVLLAWRLQSN